MLIGRIGILNVRRLLHEVERVTGRDRPFSIWGGGLVQILKKKNQSHRDTLKTQTQEKYGLCQRWEKISPLFF